MLPVQDSPELQKKVIALFEQIEHTEAREAALVLSQCGEVALEDFFAALSRVRNLGAAERIVEALALLPEDIEVKGLIELLNGVEAVGAMATRRLLALSGSMVQAAIFTALYERPDPSVYTLRLAERLTEQHGHQAALPFIEVATKTHQKGRLEILGVLAAANPAFIQDRVQMLLSVGTQEEKLEALWILRRCREPVLASLVQNMLRTEDDSWCFAMECRVLGLFRLYSSIPILLGRRANASPAFVIEIDGALEQIAGQKATNWEEWWSGVAPTWQDIGLYAAVARDWNQPEATRLAAFQKVWKMTDPAVKAAAVALLRAESVKLRSAAARAAGWLQLREAIPLLLSLLDTPESEVAWAAHGALRQLTGESFDRSEAAWRQGLGLIDSAPN